MHHRYLALFTALACQLVQLPISFAQNEARIPPVVEVVALNEETASYSSKLVSTGESKWLEFHAAQPKDLIKGLAGNAPIVGLERLSQTTKYDIKIHGSLADAVLKEPSTARRLLDMIGERVGFRVAEKVMTLDVIIVRNHTIGLPGAWVDTQLPQGFQGNSVEEKIKELDPHDHLYRAYAVAMDEVLEWLQAYSKMPLINQTALAGKYDFTFLFADKDVPRLLKTMGFDVVKTKRTFECLVVEPNAARASKPKSD
jgi:hypothetical protein